MLNETPEQDQRYMRRALELAAAARGRTSPNPMVGCVIVNNHRIVGEGFHQRAGTPHAEVHALHAAGKLARNATLYVTLEPCCHEGRTPSCADAIIRAGVQRVVAAVIDPNPLVSGKGAEQLRNAGIQVDVGVLEKESSALNEAFMKTIRTGLPFVVYKYAVTLDGKTATSTGHSQWISNEESRNSAHLMRNIYDVIMVGSGTAMLDDPALTCRIPHGRDPVRIVVDGTLRITETARVLSSSAAAPCIIATTHAAPPDKLHSLKQQANVEIWTYDTERYVPLIHLLQDIASRGWNSILLEGGGELAGKMLSAHLIDKVECFIAPKLTGRGPSPFTGFCIDQMSDAVALSDMTAEFISGDLHISAYIQNPNIASEVE